MKTCLSNQPAVAPKLNSQQQKMKQCNADAKTRKLTGMDRKSFMSTCLKGELRRPAAPCHNRRLVAEPATASRLPATGRFDAPASFAKEEKRRRMSDLVDMWASSRPVVSNTDPVSRCSRLINGNRTDRTAGRAMIRICATCAAARFVKRNCQ